MKIKEPLPNDFGAAIYLELKKRNWSQADLATRAQVHQTVVTRLIKGLRPTSLVLRKICSAWGTPKTELRLLCQHLRDEIKRAGKLHQSITVQPSGYECAAPTQVDADLDMIREEAQNHDDVRQLLTDLADMIRRHRAAQPHPYAMVADKQAEYKTKRPKRSKDAPGSDTDPAQPAR